MTENFFFGHHHRANRGDLEQIILRLLCEKPMHGYEIIRTLEERSHGFWRPSPGSVYPILQFLEEQELVSGKEEAGKKIYTITAKGQERVNSDSQSDHRHPVGAQFRAGLRFRDIRGLVRDSVHLLREVAIHGNDDQLKAVKMILQETHDKLEAVVNKVASHKDIHA
jgi:DNA-binding PadR family transcriptional regulator